MNDLISRQAAKNKKVYSEERHEYVIPVAEIDWLPSAQPEIVRCKDCRWWDRKDKKSSYGYCHAAKHLYWASNWEISIYRKHKEDFFCADGERKEDE